MAYYRSLEHVLRLEQSKIDIPDFLNGTVYVFSKTDGTCFSAWADDSGNIHCGSRHREISLEHDNADSMLFFTTEKMFANLRKLLIDNPQYILYGEFIGGLAGRKMIGTIKDYLKKGLMVFGLYDTNINQYLDYPTYSKLLNGVYDQVVEPLAVLDHPTVADIEQYIENHYNLPEDILAEGIVMWNYDFRDKFNHFQITKIVNAESKIGKGCIKIKPSLQEVEKIIINAYVTDADCEKAKQKACVKFNLDEFEVNNRTMGFYLNALYQDLIEEELWTIVKKLKNPTINFGLLRQGVFLKGRQYLGLA